MLTLEVVQHLELELCRALRVQPPLDSAEIIDLLSDKLHEKFPEKFPVEQVNIGSHLPKADRAVEWWIMSILRSKAAEIYVNSIP